jgi:hypothetical protein
MRSKKLSAAELATRLEPKPTSKSWLSKHTLLAGLLAGALSAGTAFADPPSGSASAYGNTVTDTSTFGEAHGFGTAYGNGAIAQGLSFADAFGTFGNLGGIIGEANAAAVAQGICEAYGDVGQGPCAGMNAEVADNEDDGTGAADSGECGCSGSCGGSCGCS